MRRYHGVVSPWLIGGLVLWTALVAAATARSIPVFANVSMPGLNCTPPPCPTIVTTEGIPSLITGAVVGSLLTATLIGAAWLVRR